MWGKGEQRLKMVKKLHGLKLQLITQLFYCLDEEEGYLIRSAVGLSVCLYIRMIKEIE
jgi:hypothetical protein